MSVFVKNIKAITKSKFLPLSTNSSTTAKWQETLSSPGVNISNLNSPDSAWGKYTPYGLQCLITGLYTITFSGIDFNNLNSTSVAMINTIYDEVFSGYYPLNPYNQISQTLQLVEGTIVYFYCFGGSGNANGMITITTIPYIPIGSPNTSEWQAISSPSGVNIINFNSPDSSWKLWSSNSLQCLITGTYALTFAGNDNTSVAKIQMKYNNITTDWYPLDPNNQISQNIQFVKGTVVYFYCINGLGNANGTITIQLEQN